MRENPLVRFFVERPVLTTAFFIAITLFGVFTASKLGVDLLPKFDIPIVTVTTAYPGASPEEVANQVTKPLEDTLSTLDGVDQITSISKEGISQIIIQFDYGRSLDLVAVDVSERVTAARPKLPEDVQTPVVAKFDPAAEPILYVTLTAPGTSLGELGRYATDELKPQLQQIPGVADVQVIGAPEEEVVVELQPDRLAALGIAPGQVVSEVEKAAVNVPVGSLDVAGEHQVLRMRNQPATAADVAALPLDPNRGLRVDSVANVRQQEVESRTYSRLNGDPVILLGVRKTSTANLVDVAKSVHEEVGKLYLPEGYQASVQFDRTKFTEASVRDTYVESLMTALIVSLIILILLGRVNSALSVILAIPITLSASIVVYGILGFTFNIISLLALIVAVGLVVDDAIVVAENIARWRDMGYDRMEAVIKGASEVSTAVLATTLSLLAVFLPISFLPGFIGQFFKEFGIGLATAISVSYLEAMFFLTVRLAYFPDPKPPSWRELPAIARSFPDDLAFVKTRLRSWWSWLVAAAVAGLAYKKFGPAGAAATAVLFWPALALVHYFVRVLFGVLGAVMLSTHVWAEAGMERLKEGYGHAVRWTLDHNGLVLTLALLMFASIFWVAPKLPFNFTPKADSGYIDITLTLPKGTSVLVTNDLTRRIEGYLVEQPEVDQVLAQVGTAQYAGSTESPERAMISVVLVPKNERPDQYTIADRFRRDLAPILADHPEAELRVQVNTGGQTTSYDLEFILSAPDEATLKEANRKALAILRENPTIRDVKSSLSETTTEYVFNLDSGSLSGTGLTALDVGQTLRIYTSGVEAGKVRQGGTETPIVIRSDPRYTANVGALENLPIAAPATRAMVPLGSLGSFERQDAAASIDRTDLAYSTYFSINFKDPNTGAMQAERQIKRDLEAGGVFENGVRYAPTGNSSFMGDLAATAPMAFILALVLNYLVIASQFNSFRYPIYLLLPVPLALVGAFWLAYFMDTGLDIISILGTVMMVGLVTKNAILLLDFAVERAKEAPLKEALVEAARLRLRPILMTSTTIIVVSIPLLMGIGEGSEFRRPLGVIILGGIFSSTLLTLFVIPAAFYRFERRRYAELQPER
ncbi:efflux RND transporter permease subunit [Oceanithermus sp.]